VAAILYTWEADVFVHIMGEDVGDANAWARIDVFAEDVVR